MQAIQEALVQAGVPERLKQQQLTNLAGSQRRAEAWRLGSPRSTITFTNAEPVTAAKQGTASAAGGSAVKSTDTSAEGDHEVSIAKTAHVARWHSASQSSNCTQTTAANVNSALKLLRLELLEQHQSVTKLAIH